MTERLDERGLSPTGSIYAILGFLALVALTPAWAWWVNNNTASLSLESTFLATFVLPATILLFILGWIQGAGE